MTFNASIPQAGDNPTISQGQLLTNFSVLNTDFSVNHQPFTSGNNPGLHTQIQFPADIADPSLTAPQSSLYIKTSGSTHELFYQNNNSTSYPALVQLTGLPIVTSTPGATGYGFQSPWGLIFNFGTVPSNNATLPITFQVPFINSPPIILTAMLTLQSLALFPTNYISNITQTQMTYTANANAYFLVIGK